MQENILKTHLYLHAFKSVFPFSDAVLRDLISQLINTHDLINQHGFLPLHKLSNELAFLWNRSNETLFAKTKINRNEMEKFFEIRKKTNIENLYCDLLGKNTKFLCIDDEDYPIALRAVHNAPCSIYAKGDTSLLKKRHIGIVGTRLPSQYGIEAVASIIRDLSAYHVNIVSGLAVGIDRAAHSAALSNGLTTIGVLGCGHDSLNLQEPLTHEMIDRHLIISEYPPSTQPTKFTFPMRNRIISALSDAVVVIEARHSSGAIITAKHAFHQGRDVFAVPGPITSPASQGCHDIIKMNYGHIFTCVSDMMTELKIPQVPLTLDYFFTPNIQ